MNEINTLIRAEAERVEKLIIAALFELGDKCVAEAKERSQDVSWFDHSGNLRSSIGYVVVAHGKIIRYSGFNQVRQGSEGVKEGRELAEELASKHFTGYTLIVVAGMNYAERVEALDNKVVLASAELFARQQLPTMMVKLRTQIMRIAV